MTDRTDEIVAKIKEHLAGRGIEVDELSMDSNLTQDVGLDSLDVVELTLSLEESFGIEIPDEELEDVATVRDAVELIERKLAVSA